MKSICRFTFIMLILMAGCRDEDYQIKVRFGKIGYLEKGCPVYGEDKNRIGRVADIQSHGSGTLVTLSIPVENKDTLTEFANFAIIADPQGENRNAVEITAARQGGATLPRGSVVDGIDWKPPGLIEMIRKEVKEELRRLDNHLDGISGEVDSLVHDLQALPEKQAVQEMEKELEELGRVIRESGREWKERIQKELLPELKKEIDRLKERLKAKGREEEIRPLEIKLDELQTI